MRKTLAVPLEPTLVLVGLVILVLSSPGAALARSRGNETPVEDAVEERLEITLAWLDPDGLLRSGFHTRAEEVTSPFEGIGVDVKWKRSDGGTIDTMPGEILVILLPTGPSGRVLTGDTMGAVSRNEGSRHIVFAYFPRIAEAIGIDLDTYHRTSPLQRRELAVAVGRVVAHEVIHTVAPAHPHAAEGVMREGLSGVQLVRGKAEIGHSCSVAFLEGLTPGTTAPRVATTAP
jgi:hypothetical protein